MRRSEREITSGDEIRAMLARESVVRVAFAVDNEPYIVPLSYGYDSAQHVLYLHTAAAGRKLDFVERNPRVCFEVEGPHVLRRTDKACAWGLGYESLIGYGMLSEIVDVGEKARALSCLMQQQSGLEDSWEFSASELRTVRVWQLKIESVAGKRTM